MSRRKEGRSAPQLDGVPKWSLRLINRPNQHRTTPSEKTSNWDRRDGLRQDDVHDRSRPLTAKAEVVESAIPIRNVRYGCLCSPQLSSKSSYQLVRVRKALEKNRRCGSPARQEKPRVGTDELQRGGDRIWECSSSKEEAREKGSPFCTLLHFVYELFHRTSRRSASAYERLSVCASYVAMPQSDTRPNGQKIVALRCESNANEVLRGIGG